MSVEEAVEFAFSLPPTLGAIILGPPGIGKTESVLRHARLEAQRMGRIFVFANEARASMSMSEYIDLVRRIIKEPSDPNQQNPTPQQHSEKPSEN